MTNDKLYTSYVRTGILTIAKTVPGMHMTQIKEGLVVLAQLETTKGALDAALKQMKVDGFLTTEPGISDNGRGVMGYHITDIGRAQLAKEVDICSDLWNSQ